MPDRIYLHIVWTTRDREPLISWAVQRFLCRFLPAVGRQERAEVLALGMVTTHVHVLARVHPTTSIPRLLQRWKGGSAVIAARERVVRPRGLAWAKSYSVTSVGPRQVPAVRDYIVGQARRHPREAIPMAVPKNGS